MSESADIETLKGLLTRVKCAKGSDRELDCYIEAFVARKTDTGQFHIVGPPTYDPKRFFYNPLPEVDWIGYDLLNISPAYTESVDAALALVGRCLPGWEWSVESYDSKPGLYRAAMAIDDDGCSGCGEGPTPALALIASLLAALIAEKEAGTEGVES